jgi:hypothetical protein
VLTTDSSFGNPGDGPSKDAPPERSQNTVTSYASGIVTALWVLLGLIFLSLLMLAIVLLVRAGIFSRGQLSDEEAKSVWAFLGVAFGAVVTLIGALLTEQHSRRTAAITREAAERSQLAETNQQRLAEEAEKRLVIDTVAKVLQLTTENGDYAKPARVAGAIATLVELQAGPIAARILGQLWKDEGVDTDTAVWLIDRIVERHKLDDVQDLADLIALLEFNAGKLVPSRENPEHTWARWPRSATAKWPSDLPVDARGRFLDASISLLASRDLKWWTRFRGHPGVIKMLTLALDDPDHGKRAGAVLNMLVRLGGAEVFGIDETVRLRVQVPDQIETSLLDEKFERWSGAGADGAESAE